MTSEAVALDPGDADRWADVDALLAEATASDGTSPISDQALVATRLGKRDLLSVAEEQGELAAVGIIGEGEIDMVVRPSCRGRGIGHRLLGELLARVGPTAPLRAWVHGDHPAARALLRGAGFAPVRVLLRLALPPEQLDRAREVLPTRIPGVTVRTFDPDAPDDLPALVAVNAAAFADHPEQGRLTVDDVRALMREAWFDAEDLLLAIDEESGAVVGFTWIKTQRTPAVESELYVLGVDPRVSGRGLGRTLLAETLRRMAATKPERITLYVDGENARARNLYERVGFVREAESTQWERVTTR